MKRILTAISIVMASMSLNAQDLTILHVNDTHSHIDPQRSGDYKGRGGVIEQAAYIDSVRCADGKRNVLLVHAGDFSQGTSYFTELGGNIEIDVLNALRFDVVTLGNHEFDNGIEELSRRLKNLEAEVVCANYDFEGTALDGLVKPYTIIRRGGKKIGIIGLLTDIMEVVDADIARMLTYQEPSQVVNRLSGYAASIRNVDIIVGGHSHTLLDDKQTVNDLDGEEVIIVQNWKWGLNVGHISIDF